MTPPIKPNPVEVEVTYLRGPSRRIVGRTDGLTRNYTFTCGVPQTIPQVDADLLIALLPTRFTLTTPPASGHTTTPEEG